MATDQSNYSGYSDEYERRTPRQAAQRSGYASGAAAQRGQQRPVNGAAQRGGSAAYRSTGERTARGDYAAGTRTGGAGRGTSTGTRSAQGRDGAGQPTRSRAAYGGGNGAGSGMPPRGTSGQHRKRRKKRRTLQPRFIVLIVLLVAVVGIGVFLMRNAGAPGGEKEPGGITSIFATPTPSPSPTPEPTPVPTPTPKFDTPHAVDGTNPANWGYTSQVEVNGAQAES
ncbi:MAG: hypothetical protein ACI4RE_05900, partial [Christensenellales bacterium]